MGQTYGDIECIVIDDASTDKVSYLKDYYQAKMRDKLTWYRMPRNMGRSEARNVGNNLAKTPIICVLDADDTADKDRAKITKEFFDKNDDMDLMYGSFVQIDALGNQQSKVVAMPMDYDNVMKTKLTYIGHSTLAYRKCVADSIHYTKGEYSKLGIDDWKFQMDCIKKGYKFGHVQDVLVYYRHTTTGVFFQRDNKKVLELKEKYLNETA